jgi:hypothetical protein
MKRGEWVVTLADEEVIKEENRTVQSGKVEVIMSKCAMIAIMTWLIVADYLSKITTNMLRLS